MSTESTAVRRRLLPISVVSEQSSVSERTLRREIGAGRLTATRIRSRVLIDAADLDMWIERCKEFPDERGA